VNLDSIGGELPVTVGDLLLGRPHAPGAPLEAERLGLLKALQDSPALPAVAAATPAVSTGPTGPHALDPAVAELERRLRDALATPLTDLLLRQLAGYDRLITACDAVTATPELAPGSEVTGREPVTLVDCGWLVEYAPRLTLRLAQAPPLELPAEVELIFRVPQLTAVVEHDRLTGLRADAVGIGGKLWLATEPVSERTVTVPMRVTLSPERAPALDRQQIDLRSSEIRLPESGPDDDLDDDRDPG
jgi:hypothetical protein